MGTDVKNFFNLLYGKLWVILLITLVTTSTSAFISLCLITPQYEANSTLYIMTRKYNSAKPTLSYDDIMVSKQMVKDYRELIKSKRVTSAVLKELNMTSLTDAALAGKVSVSLKNDSNVLQIKVKDSFPARARDISNTISKVFIDKVKELTSEDNIGIVDTAELPEYPVEPNHTKNVMMAFIAGLMGSIAFIFLVDQLDNTVKSTEDIEKRLGMSVLGIIPKQDIK